MMDVYKEELEAQERISYTDPKSDGDDFSTQNLHIQNPGGQQKSGNNPGKGNRCVYCGKNNHATAKCPNVTDVKVRISILRSKSDNPNQHGHINNRKPMGLLNLINSK